MGYHTTLKTSKDFYEALTAARLVSDRITETMRRTLQSQDIEVFPYRYVCIQDDQPRELNLIPEFDSWTCQIFLQKEILSFQQWPVWLIKNRFEYIPGILYEYKIGISKSHLMSVREITSLLRFRHGC